MTDNKEIKVPANLITYDDELYHFGIPRRSGRYPWGSGDRPYQGMSRSEIKEARKEKERQKNISVGRDRLTNRIERANRLQDVDRKARRIGWSNTESAAKAHKRVEDIKSVSKEILEDETRTENLGRYTRNARVAGTSLTVAGSTVAAGAAALLLVEASPFLAGLGSLAGAAAVATAGYKWLKKTHY